MRISKLLIDGFGLFDGRFELELPEGIALIVGDNETGKSTLVAAIGAILFGLGNEKERTLFAPNDSAGPRSGSLEIETNGDRYRFTRDFASNHARVEQLGKTTRVLFDGSAKPLGRTDEKEAYDRLMRTLLGLEDPALFYNSVFVEQNSLPAKMESVVRRIVSGAASADYTVALKNLKDACDELSAELPWRKAAARNKRRIERLESEFQEKRSALSSARTAGSDIEESRARLAVLESQLKTVEEDLANAQAQGKDLEAFSRTIEEKKRLEEQLNECRDEMRDVEKLTQELKKCDERIQNEFADCAQLPASADEDFVTLAQLTENRDDLEKRYRQAESEFPEFQLPRHFTAAMIAGALVAALGIFLLHGTLTVACILMGLAIFLWPLVSALLSIRAKRSVHEGKLNEMREQLGLLKSRAAEITNRYPVLSRKSPSAVTNKLREFRNLQQEKGKKEEALKHRRSLEEIESKYNTLSNNLLLAGKKLDDLKAQRPSLSDVEKGGQVGKAIEENKASISQLEEQQRKLGKEREQLKMKLAAAEAKETVSEETLEEEIAEAKAKLSQLKLSRDAYLMAVKVLEEAIAEFGSSHLTRIAEKTSDYLTRITGTPCRVQLNKELEPLAVERGGQHFTSEQLSTGIGDQLHFALRLAAIEEVCGDIRLPILLDDPFVNFDESRLRATLRALEALAESHQIVLLTHDRRYCDWREPTHLLER